MSARQVRSSVDEYIESLRGIRPLSSARELELAAAYKAGDERAGAQLVEASLAFVIRVAVEYRRWGAPMEDLIQQGNLGLLHAARKFDGERGCRLITYAVYWIRAEIRDYLVRTYRIVRLGTTRSERRAMRAFRREGAADAEELAGKSGMPLARCQMLWPLLTQNDSSLDISAENNSPGVERLSSEILDPEQAYGRAVHGEEVRLAVRSALRKLDVRERRIARARLLADRPATLEHLGRELGVSKERVRQLECRLKLKLKDALSEYADVAA